MTLSIRQKVRLPILRLSLGICTVICMQTAHARAGAEWCETRFDELQKPFSEAVTPDYKKLLAQWKQLAPTCIGTGVYEGRLVGLYLRLHKTGDAEAILQAIKDPTVLSSPVVKAARLHTSFMKLALHAGTTIDGFRALEPQYLIFLKEEPNWEGSYELVSGYELSIGNADKAIRYGEQAQRMLPDAWVNYRTLAIAYSMLGRHTEAVEAGDRAQSLNKVVSADTEFMFALAKSYAAIGDKETLKAILALVVHYHPDIRKRPDFVETMKFIHNKLADETPKR